MVTSDKPDEIDVFHFGLVPHWAKDKKVGFKMINAKSETLLEKPSFKPLVEKIKDAWSWLTVFLSGKKMERKSSHSGFTYLKERFFFAGLWSNW